MTAHIAFLFVPKQRELALAKIIGAVSGHRHVATSLWRFSRPGDVVVLLVNGSQYGGLTLFLAVLFVSEVAHHVH